MEYKYQTQGDAMMGPQPTQYESGSQPAVIPPGASQWMVRPAALEGVPPGLEYLTQLDQILIHQQVELFEAFTGIETKNRYAIKNSLGQQCYFAYEESDLCMRLCCGNMRGFQMHIVDNTGKEVIRAYRDFRCCVGCCWCISGETCAFIVPVESPTGVPIGRIIQLCSAWKPKYAIQNERNETILIIQGPCCVWSGPCCPQDVPFEIKTADESQTIGRLARQYAGLAKEWFTDATNFGINFPMDLDVKAKALLLSATFLIDMMFFEKKNNDNN
uniref:phospholipid scramblase 1-like n=1 Tax=Styela clava TaxID=7725 RepID=UPI001939E546|nr:phospholipid scramblase 1-like [Styela clava]